MDDCNNCDFSFSIVIAYTVTIISINLRTETIKVNDAKYFQHDATDREHGIQSSYRNGSFTHRFRLTVVIVVKRAIVIHGARHVSLFSRERRRDDETTTQQHNNNRTNYNKDFLKVCVQPASPKTMTGMATKVAETVKAFLDAHFQEHERDISTDGPQLGYFKPMVDALLGSLWDPQWKIVPARQSLSEQDGFITKQRPNFLLYGLDDTNAQFSQPAAHKHICTAQQQGPSFLYGTSGTGKKRSVFVSI